MAMTVLCPTALMCIGGSPKPQKDQGFIQDFSKRGGGGGGGGG